MTAAPDDPRSLVRNARALLQGGGADHPHRRGMEQAGRGEYLEAITSFREAIAAVPDAPWSYVALGEVLLETGARDEAATAFRSALERTPPNAFGMLESLATGLRRAGDPATAIPAFRAVLAAEPGRQTAVAGLAQALLSRANELRTEAAQLLVDADDLVDDEALIGAAIDAAPHVHGLYRRLAQSLARRGDGARAIAVLQIGLARDPHDPASLATLAELLAAEDPAGDALPPDQREHLLGLVHRAVLASPDDLQLLLQQARLATRYGSAQDAVAAWEAVVDRAPGEALWHRELGDRLAAAGDFEAAGAAYDQAVGLGYEVY